jgi:hypothetical protein
MTRNVRRVIIVVIAAGIRGAWGTHYVLGRFSEAEGEEKCYVASGNNNVLRWVERKAVLLARPTCYLLRYQLRSAWPLATSN